MFSHASPIFHFYFVLRNTFAQCRWKILFYGRRRLVFYYPFLWSLDIKPINIDLINLVSVIHSFPAATNEAADNILADGKSRAKRDTIVYRKTLNGMVGGCRNVLVMTYLKNQAKLRLPVGNEFEHAQMVLHNWNMDRSSRHSRVSTTEQTYKQVQLDRLGKWNSNFVIFIAGFAVQFHLEHFYEQIWMMCLNFWLIWWIFSF